MKYRYISFILLLWCMGMSQWLHAQQETQCNPLEGLPVAKGEVNFVYGTTANAFSNINKSDVVVGQPLIGTIQSQPYTGDYGIFAVLRMAPQAPIVQPSQGDFPDRVLIKWSVDPLGPGSTGGFIITRDGAYLSSVEPGNLEFIDFNVQAGEFYQYGVRGINNFGQGVRGLGVGFVNPNGVVTGKITTANGNPVPDAIVTLSPSIGTSLLFDGNGSNICVSHNAALSTDMFTVSAWVKIGATHDSDGIIDLGSDLNKNFWIHTTPASMAKGVVIGVGDGTAHEITHEFTDIPTTVATDERDGWHHVAAVYGGGALILYVDGKFVTSMQAAISGEPALFSIGSRRDQTGFFDGNLDEVRIYDRLLTQTELVSTKDITVSKLTEGLVAYWKFDEGLGTKVFDISYNNMDGTLNGTSFSNDTPGIKNGAMTDVTGYYFIEGINYSQEQVFQARPQKSFYNNYALEFNAAYQSCAELTNFDLPDTSHIELTVHPFDLTRKQSILSKVQGGTDAFNLFLENGQYKLTINGETQVLGNAAAEYQHLALSMNGTTGALTYYLNGNLVSTLNYANLTGTWSGEAWQLAAKGTATPTDFYTGLIDEVAFYSDSLLTLPEIQLHASQFGNGGTDIGHGSLLSYFDLNEGSGDEVFDSGPALTGYGAVKEASYSFITFRQADSPHEFLPNYRFININNSATAVSNVDFTDNSTVPITGVVRFKETFCYQDSVEILVNGAPFFPPIFTNEDGRFVADFEPGVSVVLTPKFGEGETAHEFYPPFFEARKLNVPIANVLFQNLTTREVEGQVFGGLCRKSVIPQDANGDPVAIVKVKLAALNGCYEDVIQLENINGKYKFKKVPPIPVAVSVIEHSNNAIYSYFQVQGGTEVDLRNIERDTVDFMYIAPPNVQIDSITSGLLGNECGLTLIYDSQKFSTPKLYTNKVRVFQIYDGGDCYLDSFNLIINNGIAEYDQQALHSDTSTYLYEWYANNPNMLAPHTKTLQVTAEVEGLFATSTYQAIVLGERQLPGTISTAGPSEVFGVVYDPPGDGSSATLVKNTETCVTWEDINVNSENATTDVAFKLGMKKAIVTGVGIASVETFEVGNTTTLSGSFEASQSNSNSAEFCFSTTKEISTSDGDDIWGTYADVYFGAAMNFEIGARDILDYNFEDCDFTTDQTLTISPNGFATDFVYSEWQILTEVIPQLNEIIANATVTEDQRKQARASKAKWLSEIANKRLRQKNALYDRNITFDAAVNYTETVSSTLTGTNTYTTTIGGGVGIQNEHGWEWSGFGVDWTIQAGWNHTHETTEGVSTSNSVETSFTLADDDLNDFYSVDVATGAQPTLGFGDLSGLEDDVDDLENQIATLYDFDNTIENTGYQVSSLNNAPFATAPMFKVKGGESKCPWIPGTRNREEVSIYADQNVAINVPSNTPAVFRVTLGSIGPNGTDGVLYELGVDVEAGNPDGAIIKVDGTSLVNPVGFQFVGNSSVEKTITVEYPNTGQYSFEDLGLYFASSCQIEHSVSVGFYAGDGGFLIYDDYQPTVQTNGEKEIYSRFYLPLVLDVHFVEPCTPIDIAFPLQNHTVTPGNENLFVTLSEYDNEDADLDVVRLQYRPIPGDGSWINILELTPADFVNDPVFKIVQWNMIELKDGAYELRAVADCEGTIGGNLSPGISEIIKVIKETEAPELFGAPQPADGILSPGDEISITFNENINCNQIFDADGIGTNINLNNIALINTETGALVPFSHQCLGNKIIISPEVQSKYLNGKVLKARATAIEDLAGNEMEVPIGAPGSPTENFKEWEFLVDLNPLRWEAGSNIQEVVEVGTALTLTRNITNKSGAVMDYAIRGPRIDHPDGSVNYGDLPEWGTIYPTEGALEPGEVKAITFTFPETLPQNEYDTEINVVGTDGNKAIDVDLRVICPAPLWSLDPTAFNYTMNFTVQLDIEGEMSEDNMDMVGAFVGGELRGMSYVQYEAELDKWLAFLTVYSNVVSGETLDFQIWDARECLLYGEVLENFDFILDGLVGSPLVPQVLHTNNQLLRKIPVHPGWNWISFNLNPLDKNINPMLSSLEHPTGGLMKSQSLFSQYHTASSQWLGSLTTLGYKPMYQYKSVEHDTILHVGSRIDPDTVNIAINTGWNWIGYLPFEALSPDDALATLTPLNGDVVKSQTAFAQYVAGLGWIGNLDYLSAPNGYLLKIGNPGVLTYPGINLTGDPVEQLTVGIGQSAVSEAQSSIVNLPSSIVNPQSLWTVDPSQFEYSMNVIAIVGADENLLEEGDVLGAFAGDEVRGGNEAIFVEPLQAWLVFLTAYANSEGEELKFKFYDASAEDIHRLNEALVFATDLVEGTVEEPQVFTLQEVGTTTSEAARSNWLEVYPNPAGDFVFAAFGSQGNETAIVRITDSTGRLLQQFEVNTTPGLNLVKWATEGAPSGAYFLTLTTGGETLTKRVIKMN